MNIHEYQAKEIFRKYNVPVPRGIVATSPQEALKAAKELGGTAEIVDFIRLEVGEGIEKKEEDFAAEVAAQMAQ